MIKKFLSKTNWNNIPNYQRIDANGPIKEVAGFVTRMHQTLLLIKQLVRQNLTSIFVLLGA